MIAQGTRVNLKSEEYKSLSVETTWDRLEAPTNQGKKNKKQSRPYIFCFVIPDPGFIGGTEEGTGNGWSRASESITVDFV